MLATPFVFYLAHGQQYNALLVVFFMAAWTDAFDGWVARWLRVESKFGQVLDPLADKVLLTASFLALTLSGAIPLWLTVVVLGRDVAILAGAGVLWMLGKRTDFPPSVWGKLSTIAQMGYVVILLFNNGQSMVLTENIVATLAAVSLADYARRMSSQK